MLAAVILALAGFIAGGHRTAHPGAGLVLGLSGSGVGLALHARVRGSNGLPREWAGSGFRTGSGLVFGAHEPESLILAQNERWRQA